MMAKVWTVLALCLLVFVAPSDAQGESKSVLFVGNSYTSANGQNNIGNLFSLLAEEGVPGWTDVATERVTSGGYTFKKHLSDANQPGSKLHAQLIGLPPETHDYVVLQEQSQIPGFHAANSPLWTESLEAALLLDDLIEAAASNTVFFMTWGRRDGDAQNVELYPDYISMQLYLDTGYHLYAKETASSDRVTTISPVGRAFQELFEDEIAKGEDPLNPTSLFHSLYSGDGSHPSLQGTYLSAAVLYATLTGRDPTLLQGKPEALSAPDRDALLALAKRVVFDKPYDHFASIWGPLPRYPWVEAYTPPQGDILGIGSSGAQSTVYLDTTAPPIGTLEIGKEEDQAGRLGVLDGSSMTVTNSLKVGVNGTGLLECIGGTLTAGEVLVAANQASVGTVVIDGGTLDVQEITGGTGLANLTMHSGQLRAQSVGFGWEQAGGTWSLPVDGSSSEVDGPYSLDKNAVLRFTMTTPSPDSITFGSLTVKGNATLRGTIAIDTPGGLDLTEKNEVLLMVAENFSTDDLKINLPPGSTWEVVPHQTVLFALKLTFVPTSSSPVTFDPPPGPYDAPLEVTLSTDGGAMIHYTTDGSSVSQNSPSAPSPLMLQLTELGPHTLRAIAVNAFGVASQPSGGSYLLLAPPSVNASPGSGQYDAPLTVTLAADRDNCTIYWTLDGTDPSTKAAILYEEPIVIDVNGTYVLKARAVSDTGVEGPILTVDYQLGDTPIADVQPSDDVMEPEVTEVKPSDTGDTGVDVVVPQTPTANDGCSSNSSHPPLTLLLLLGLGILFTASRRLRHSATGKALKK